ncbi:MAG: DEAD/DEAH box helicase, partial [Microvirga sp.]
MAQPKRKDAAEPPLLPERFRQWFEARGWTPRPHQLALLAKAREGRSALLVAPTGAGKTLAGFLPTLVELAERSPERGGGGGESRFGLSPTRPSLRSGRPSLSGEEQGRLHTLYISPLKALAVDIARNLEAPAREMALAVRVETRTGDTPAHKRARQLERPPDILLTTPEQLALLLAHRDARALFCGLKRVILDELHSLVTSKRGDLLALGLARLYRLAPGLTATGLSATVREPDELRRYLAPQGRTPPAPHPGPLPASGERGIADLLVVEGGARPDIHMLAVDEPLPMAGHLAMQSMPAIYGLIRQHRTTLVFVNTRMQAEAVFQALWDL